MVVDLIMVMVTPTLHCDLSSENDLIFFHIRTRDVLEVLFMVMVVAMVDFAL